MKEQTKVQLLKKIRDLKTRITEFEMLESKHKELRQVIIDSNRRLQESTQKLYNAQQELKVSAEKEKKRAKELKAENKRIIAEQKRITKQSDKETSSQDKKIIVSKERRIDKTVLRKLLTKYENLLDVYIKMDQKETDALVNELCKSFIQNNLSPRKIVDIHIVSVKKIADDINKNEALRKISTVRMVLLMVMTKYASLLRTKH